MREQTRLAPRLLLLLPPPYRQIALQQYGAGRSRAEITAWLQSWRPIAEETGSLSIVKAGIDIDPPRALHRIQPQYTEAARRIRFEGAVVLSLLIDSEGRVAEIEVLSALPFGLTENAVSAVRQWLFEPCTYNERPVSVRMILTVRFNIAS